MNTHSTNKTWVWLAIIVLIAGVGYFYVSGGSVPVSTALLQPTGGDTSSDVGTQVLGLLNQIQSISIDTTLFSDPAYSTLRDYSVTIPPVSVGRVNPFAPLPGLPVTTGQTGQ